MQESRSKDNIYYRSLVVGIHTIVYLRRYLRVIFGDDDYSKLC